MKYIVFDTEFTSWEGSMENNWSREGEHRELVQIGALKISDGEIIDKLDILVKPQINPILSDYFQKLTLITNKDISEKGIHIYDALEKFYQFSKNFEIYSYGNDYSIILENLILNKAPIRSKFFSENWKNKFYDFKTLLYDYEIDPSKYTSGTIYKAFNIKMDSKHKVHNALRDAYSLYLSFEYILSDIV